jgi:hypothetical protein
MLSKKIPVVSVDSLFKGIDKVAIDQDIYETLLMMLKGSDEDKSVAMNMLYNCNIDASFYYIWKLMNEVSYGISYYKHRNTKAHKTFMESIMSVVHSDAMAAIKMFKDKGCLTEQIYNELLEQVYNKFKTYRYIEEVMQHSLLNIVVEKVPYEIYIQTIKTEPVNDF